MSCPISPHYLSDGGHYGHSTTGLGLILVCFDIKTSNTGQKFLDMKSQNMAF